MASAVVLLALAAYHAIDVAVTESYSSEWRSASSAEAATRGVLVSRPVLPVRRLRLNGDSLLVTDAWVERRTHVRYVLFLVPRTVIDSGFRLVVTTARLGAGGHSTAQMGTDEWLAYGDTTKFGTWSGDDWTSEVVPPFADTLRLKVLGQS